MRSYVRRYVEMVGELTELGKSGMEADGYGRIKCMTSLMAGGKAGMSAREMKQAAVRWRGWSLDSSLGTQGWEQGQGRWERTGKQRAGAGLIGFRLQIEGERKTEYQAYREMGKITSYADVSPSADSSRRCLGTSRCRVWAGSGDPRRQLKIGARDVLAGVSGQGSSHRVRTVLCFCSRPTSRRAAGLRATHIS